MPEAPTSPSAPSRSKGNTDASGAPLALAPPAKGLAGGGSDGLGTRPLAVDAKGGKGQDSDYFGGAIQISLLQSPKGEVSPEKPVLDRQDSEDWVDALPESCVAPPGVLARRRRAISTPCVVGGASKDGAIRGSVIQKTPEQEQNLLTWLLLGSLSPWLKEMPEEDVMIAVPAFRQVIVAAGQHIIKQGDEAGLEFFILESGRLEAYKRDRNSDSGLGKLVGTYDKPGQSFGELALLHEAPRAATVVATAPSCLWSLDHDSFRILLHDNAIRRRERHTEFLKSVKLLQRLDLQAISQLVDSVKVEVFYEGEFVLLAGHLGSSFFIVEEGEAVARVNGVDARRYSRGSYFGELALIKDRPRAADVYATSSVLRVLKVDRPSFQRLLGPNVLFDGYDQGGGGSPTSPASNKSKGGVRFAPEDKLEQRYSVGQQPDVEKGKPMGLIPKEELTRLLSKTQQGRGVTFQEPGDADAGANLCIQSDELRDLVDSAASKGGLKEKKAAGRGPRGTGYIQADQLQKLLAEQEAMEEQEDEWDPVDSHEPPPRGMRGTGFVDAAMLQKLLDEAEVEDTDGEVPRKKFRLPCLCGGNPK